MQGGRNGKLYLEGKLATSVEPSGSKFESGVTIFFKKTIIFVNELKEEVYLLQIKVTGKYCGKNISILHIS